MGAVCSGSTLIASILNLSVMLGDNFSRRHLQMHFFLGALSVNSLSASDELSSVAYFCKEFGPRSGSINHQALPGSKMFDPNHLPEKVFGKSYFV